MIKAYGGNVIVKTASTIESKSGIIIPEQYRVPYHFGEVIAAGPGEMYPSNVEPGDIVSYHLQSTNDVDGVTKKALEIDGHLCLYMHVAMLQFKVTNEEKMKDIKKLMKESSHSDTIQLDYRKDVEMFGYKVGIQLEEEPKSTESGIILPNISMGKKIYKGVVVCLSEKANSIYNEPELEVGMTVMIDKAPSGGMMPLSDENPTWRLNSQEICAKFDEESGQWTPIGGRAFVRPVLVDVERVTEDMPHPTIAGATIKQEGYVMKSHPDIFIPNTAVIATNQGEIVAAGKGWSNDWRPAKAFGTAGPQPYNKGDIVLFTKIIDRQGNPVRGVELIEIEDEELYILPVEVIDARVTGHMVSELQPVSLKEDSIDTSVL